MKKIISLLLVMVLAFAFVSCNNENTKNNNENMNENNAKVTMNEEETSEETSEEVKEAMPVEYPVTLTDGMGREVTIDAAPQKIVSLAPSMTEMVYAFGLGDALVGRTSYCDFPAETLDVADMGFGKNVNIESIIGSEADIVLMSTHADEEVLKSLEEAGITVVVLIAQEEFEGVYEIMAQFGTIFDANEEAETLMSEMKSEVASLVELVKDVEKQTVYYALWFGTSDSTATGDTFIHQMIKMAGGLNIAADATGWGYNLEDLIANDPYNVIVSNKYDSKTTFSTTEGYSDLTAVKEGRILEIDTNLLDRQGPRQAEGLRALIELMYPEVLK